MRKIDKPYIWINLSMLLFVALLPFSTSFSGDFPGVMVEAIVFEANLFLIGMGMFCHWLYATHGHRLVESTLANSYIRYVLASNLVVPFVSVVGIIISLAGIGWSNAVYLTLPIVGYIVYRLTR